MKILELVKLDKPSKNIGLRDNKLWHSIKTEPA